MSRLPPALVLLAAGTFAPRPSFAQTLPEREPDDVAAVLFLVGDAGAADVESSPLLHHLHRGVEHWSQALGRDSAVTVLFLGDNVYPEGVRDGGDHGFVADTTHLSAQAWVVEGPQARRHHARAVFVPGNHDWGNMTGAEGVARLRNEARVIGGWADQGRPVSLVPAPGTPGPTALHVGPALVAVLDTEWWLQSQDDEAKEVAVDSLENILLSARGAPVVVAAHHPMASVGPHGHRGIMDPGFLLAKAGALVQDLNSGPYRDMRAAFSRAFAQSDRPLAFVAGHDHTLQVLRTAGPGQPGWTLVSGAGSKTSDVGSSPEVAWAAGEPGSMRLMFMKDGGVFLYVDAAPPETESCPAGDEQEACLEQGVGAYQTVFAARLR